jgi:hypothetical protein
MWRSQDAELPGTRLSGAACVHETTTGGSRHQRAGSRVWAAHRGADRGDRGRVLVGDPVQLHASTRRSMAFFGAVRLNGKTTVKDILPGRSPETTDDQRPRTHRRYASIHSAPVGRGSASGSSRIGIACRKRPLRQTATI